MPNKAIRTEKGIMNKDEKQQEEKKPSAEEKKVLKVGGLWVDPASFPSLNEEKDESSSQP